MHDSATEIKKYVLASAELYGKTLSKMTLEVWVQTLSHLTGAEISYAFAKHLRQSKWMPTPAEILEHVRPEVTSDQQAVEISNKIVCAMSSCGHTNPDRAKEQLGELGWQVVELEGGWENLCRRTTEKDLPISKAQWRELAKSLLRRTHIEKTHTQLEAASAPSPQRLDYSKLLGGPGEK